MRHGVSLINLLCIQGDIYLSDIIEIVRAELDGVNYLEVDVVGSFVNESNNKGKSLTPGSVYGFFASLDQNEVQALFKEANDKGSCRLKNVNEFKPIIGDIYPLYWGKDKSLGSRINAHINNPEGGTGIVRFCAYKCLHGKKISCIAVVVNDNSSFEKHLQKKFPDILLTKRNKI
jgi:hypothetical protein